MKRLRFVRDEPQEVIQEHEYWMSFSDLMAGLLMVFALMILASLYHYQSGVEGIREVLAVRQQVVEQLQAELSREEGRVIEVDSDGTVRFLDNVLFQQGSAVVSEDGREQLAVFTERYLSILLSNDEFRQQLRRVVIEGHTNDDGSYEFNLDLSQRRALAVMLVLLAEAGQYRADLQELVSANGRSESDLILLTSGEVDKARSRRIEIRFQLNDDELVGEVLDHVFRTADQ